MDEGLFIFMLFCGFLMFAAIIYCFLSTCLGMQIRGSDVWEAMRFQSMSSIRERDRQRRQQAASRTNGEFELDDLDPGMGGAYGRMGGMGGPGPEELEMFKRNGPGRFY